MLHAVRGQLLATISGSSGTARYTAASGTLKLTFNSDGAVGGRGFSATWTCPCSTATETPTFSPSAVPTQTPTAGRSHNYAGLKHTPARSPRRRRQIARTMAHTITHTGTAGTMQADQHMRACTHSCTLLHRDVHGVRGFLESTYSTYTYRYYPVSIPHEVYHTCIPHEDQSQ